jgi:transcription initiation factor IIE alpha subunit
MTGVERLKKFVCEKDGVKEAFSGKCPKCGKDLQFKDEEKPAEKKKKRDYRVDGDR